MPTVALPTEIRFGVFAVRPDAGELRKNGRVVPLHDKPLRLLLALLARPGDVVTRQELQEQLWPGQSFLEFDNGLNNVVSRLRRVLDDTRTPHRYIETVPLRGYRLLPEVVALPGPDAALSWGRRWFWSAALGMVVVFGAWIGYPRSHARPAPRSVAVLAFRSPGESAGIRDLAVAMTWAVHDDLAQWAAGESIARVPTAWQFRARGPGLAAGHLAAALVEGAVAARPGGRIRVTVQLVRPANGRPVWTGSYEGSVTNLPVLPTEVARGLARAIGFRLPPASAAAMVGPLDPAPQWSSTAFSPALFGASAARRPNHATLLAGWRSMLPAAGAPPRFAPADLGVSRFYLATALHSASPRADLRWARTYAEQAVRLAPGSAPAHLQLADIAVARGNWQAANREFRRALILAPRLVSAYIGYAV